MALKMLSISLLTITLCACSNAHIVRNYEYAPPNCDCYVHNGLSTGGYTSGRSFYRFRQKARCSKINRAEILDSLDLFTRLDYDLQVRAAGYDTVPDSISTLIALNDSLVDVYGQWTDCKVRTKYLRREYGANDKIITIRQKFVFYRRGIFRLKRTGKAKFVNGVAVKSSMR